MHLGVLEKISGLHSRAKVGVRKKLVIFAFNFTAARRSRRARNRINKVRSLAKRIDQRGLACARWRRNDKKNSVTAELFTQDFGPAPESFPVPLCRRQRAVKWRHHLLLRRAYSVREKFPA